MAALTARLTAVRPSANLAAKRRGRRARSPKHGESARAPRPARAPMGPADANPPLQPPRAAPRSQAGEHAALTAPPSPANVRPLRLRPPPLRGGRAWPRIMADPADAYPASYAAFFAPRTHKFDTVDFRLPASRANLAQYFAKSTRENVARARIAGVLGVILGIGFSFVGFGVDQLTRGLTIAVYRAAERLFRDASFWPAAVVFVAICLLFVTIAACMVIYIAPLGAGSGIPELKSYLNGVKIPGFLAANSLLVKALGVAFSLSSGLFCGKQGPMIHAGAIAGAGLSQMASSRFHWRLQSRRLRFLRTEAWKRDFTAVGAGVGVAVAFGSPMGAWMWVYEEACTHWTWDLGIITLSGCLAGAIVTRILNFIASGVPGGGFGTFTLTMFGKLVTPFGGTRFPLKDIPAFALIGVVGGIIGALLPLINKQLTLFRYKHFTRPVPRILEAIGICAITAIIRLVIPHIADDCREMDADLQNVVGSATLGDYAQFTCPEGQFSPWASLIYNPSDTVVRGLLFAQGPDLFPAGAVAVAFAYYLVFMIWTYGLAVPAGVFFPGFVLGAVYGRLIGIAVESIFPDRTDVSLTGYAFIGAISALAGITRTISVAVIALEATGGNDASFAAVFVSVIAKLVGDVLYRRGIYDLHIGLKGIPFLSSQIPNLEQYIQLRVSDLMESTVIGVRRLSRLGGLVHMLGTNDHHAFPVFVKLKVESKNNSLSIESEESSPQVRKNDSSDVLSETSDLEAELDRRDSDIVRPSLMQSRIITPSHFGMQATIFDEGVARIVQLDEAGDVNVVAVGTPSTKRARQIETTAEKGSGGSDTSDTAMANIPDFELIGTIDRGTLLAIVKNECDKRYSQRESQVTLDQNRSVLWDDMDAAWPNCDRLKGEGEKQILRRVNELNLSELVVDLRKYVDPDPLLMSDRAVSMAAYKLFRGTGARHILVTDMRGGRVNGILTRKDILPESIDEVIKKMQGLKVE